MKHPSKSKLCTTCRTVKPLTDFNRQLESPDGRRYVCKECEKKKDEQKKAQDIEYGKKYFTF